MTVGADGGQPMERSESRARGLIRLQRPTVLVTGGAGFVGTNLCLALLDLGCKVRVLDNLSHDGVRKNARTLETRGGKDLVLLRGDVRSKPDVERAVLGVDAVFHLAAQVAVTTSVLDPAADFETNARGTLNVLETVRKQELGIPLLFTSTSRIYGRVESIPLVRLGRRYQPDDSVLALLGIGERTLDFQAPYGCSRGIGEQYVLDHARSLCVPATVFRMGSVYGPYQRADEDQGWVAYFLDQMLDGGHISIHGDGCQVRDVLYVEDLVEAFLAFLARPERLAGRPFNVGGGATNAVSVLELLDLIGELLGTQPPLRFVGRRSSDQRWYVSDTRRLRSAAGWRPRVQVRQGLERLLAWLLQERRTEMRSARLHEPRENPCIP